MKGFISFLTALTMYSSFCIHCSASNNGARQICQRTPVIDVEQQTKPMIIIKAPEPVSESATDQRAARFSDRYDPILRSYSRAVVADMVQHWVDPIENGCAIANIAIDRSGKLLWIRLENPPNMMPAAFNKALIHAIVQSAPFSPFPAGSPAKVIIQAPVCGPEGDSLEPGIVEYATKPTKLDWECSNSSSTKLKHVQISRKR